MAPVRKCGLLGEHLGHSYSPQIHRELAEYSYPLYEKAPDEVADFVLHGDFEGLNVTIPYKKTVLPLCDELSPAAATVGSVNTLVRRGEKLYGDNTDVYGFTALVHHSGIDVNGKKTLIFGNGGACVAVKYALEQLGARVIVISRRGEDNYTNLDRHRDAEVLVNTTPLGMYPKTGEAPVDLRNFPACRGVLDIVYNPSRTKLLLQAEELGIPNENGLYMLVAQAKRSCEQFLDRPVPDAEIERVRDVLLKEMRNIVLIGMPGCGKSTAAQYLHDLTGREVCDADAEIVRRAGRSIPEIFADGGEDAFRKMETAVLADLGMQSGKIIATGGGCVTRPENYPLLHQNGILVWMRREISALPTNGRPLSQQHGPEELYRKRKPLYERFADVTVDVAEVPDETAQRILDAVK